ncbi:hypothetical protein Fmac_023965 [Flemingia macrophylla]|uniref:Uncharacterized protein n=1 Tax=Flemingia macrophylla TaxID=520843 RepID=A0ABD1LN14_9FABA
MSKNSEMKRHPPQPKPSFSLFSCNFTKQHRKPNIVRFPKTKVVVPPLQVKAKPKDHHSFFTSKSNDNIIFQFNFIKPSEGESNELIFKVYSLGGLIFSKWVGARWNDWHHRESHERVERRHSDYGNQMVIFLLDKEKGMKCVLGMLLAWKIFVERCLLKIENVGLKVKMLK